MSMNPGVTYFPPPSITTASDGAVTLAPTDSIFPSFRRIEPFVILGPAAVKMVTFLMTVVFDGKGLYVLGNGSAFWAESAPRPAFVERESLPCVLSPVADTCGAGAWLPFAGEHASTKKAVANTT